MSLKYTILKTMFHIIPIQKIMAKPYDELMKIVPYSRGKDLLFLN